MERPGGKSLPLSGESSSTSMRDYEVFLSFRGPDTRLTVTDSLYAAMIRAGIHVFKDDEELRVGEEIGGELMRAISNSKIYVPIFSKDYASSKWCLRELAYMVEHRKREEKAILPIFYEVDASDVKLKTGSYGKALQKHERESGEDVAKQWEEALREVAGIKGWNLKDHGQDKLIALVLEEVFNKLRSTERNWHDDLVGIHYQMEAVMELLGQGTPGVRFVVIYGMGGIGKTTLAKAIFKRISSQFQCSSFLSDIHADNILSLQNKLLSDILDIRHLFLIDAGVGRDMIKERLGDKKVIIVLDDMDKRDQLMKLAGNSSWFGSGSRIIITTRNTQFLVPETDTLDNNIIPVRHQDFFFYEMKEMQFDHALQLFSKHSFERDSPPHDYGTISREIVEITGRLPLALVVIGSLLHLKSEETWKDTLKKLKKMPNQDVQKKLLISYEELEYEQQQIFLDIACHCIGEERIPAYYMWKACEFFPKSGLRVLIRLSLIKVIKDDRLWMHDQLRDLGREIVRQECLLVPGKRSRLWCPTVALDVVQNNLGTDNIVALRLADGHNFTSDEFSRLPSLRFLELDGGNFVGDFKNLLSNLTWLSWRHCPSNLQASSLCLRKLAVLKLSESGITEDWNGWGPCMGNDNLKVINLTRCKCLMRTPDFSKCMNLKILVIKECELLKEINSSIGQLGRLKCLEIIEEPRLWMQAASVSSFNNFTAPVPHPLLPDSIGGLKSLSMLKVEYQGSVKALPHSIGELLGLKHLSLRGCAFVRKLPNSVGQLRSLLCLDLSGTDISELPYSIGRLESLLKMDLSRTNIAELPNSIGNLKQLKFMCLDWTKIRELPKSIWTLENLEELTARGCQNLEGEIPSEIAGLSQLTILNLSQSKVSGVPMTLNQLSNLRELVLTNCNGLQSLPDLPTSLTKLELSSSSVQSVPDLPRRLSLSSFFPLLSRAYYLYCRQHPKLEWLGRLHELQTLRLVLSDFNFPPTDLSSLSQLRSLEITCPDPRSLTRLPSSLKYLSLEDVRTPIEWPLFSNLGNLSELKLFGCQLREIEFDNELGQLENLRRLQVRKCGSLVRLSNLSSLKELRVLSVEYCPKLTEIESQPLSTGDCSSTERPIPDSLKLEKLESFRVYYCASVRKLPAIPNACRVDVIPQKYVRRSESGPVFIEDLANSTEDSGMEILSEGELRRPWFYCVRLHVPQNSQEEFLEELLS
ncbi:disease resistance protein L6-like isoform X2 [Syzygium oleosum]|uniref:disease resistance protein L6-like isoform X2 n=1 Tax=Syzygium oleosum TaxID=219896 RepID=UPI0024B8F058|nr:disease resistance protein L6-like isoform X2 [Syzygium oleosum]